MLLKNKVFNFVSKFIFFFFSLVFCFSFIILEKEESHKKKGKENIQRWKWVRLGICEYVKCVRESEGRKGMKRGVGKGGEGKRVEKNREEGA